MLAAAGAGAVMAMDASDNGPDRWEIDMVVGVYIAHVGGSEGVIAMRADGERCLNDLIGMLGERACHAGVASAGLLLAGARQVRFLAFRGW